MPTSVVARLKIRPAESARFEREFSATARKVLESEPGTLVYQLCRNDKSPAGEYVVMEVYESNAAIKAHSAAFKASMPPWTALLAGKPSIQAFKVVGPTGLKKGTKKSGVAIVATIPVRADKCSDFEAEAQSLMGHVQSKEDGCLLYCLGKHAKGSKYTFVELYDSYQAVKQHGKTDYFAASGKRQRGMVAGRPEIELLRPIEPQASSKL